MSRSTTWKDPRMPEQAVLVALHPPGTPISYVEETMNELSRLAETAGATVSDQVVQRGARPDPATLIGRGKAMGIAQFCRGRGIGLLVVDAELSPAQVRNLEALTDLKVVDRTELIMDIFAQRARTREGKLQVELAQLRYLLPKLVGMGPSLSRLGGGIGTRGPGEMKLEVDRRRIRDRIRRLEKSLQKVRASREQQRGRRKQREIPLAALVGYTNAGKSSLLNRLTGSSVLVEDKLFATLDPTIRRLRVRGRSEILISDTVGFLRRLPHQLVAAFMATLEEVREASLLVHVVDAAHSDRDRQIESVDQVLEELGVGDRPRLLVWNKIDRVGAAERQRLREREPESILVSARTGEGIDQLLEALEKRLVSPVSRASPLRQGADLEVPTRT